MSTEPDHAEQPFTVGFISLGCAKNLVDSETMAGKLLDEQILLAHDPEEADIIIINTCSFINDAREESIEIILQTCELKKNGRCRAIIVAGCMPQRYEHELEINLPEVDAFIGLDELENVPDIVRRLQNGEKNIFQVSKAPTKLYEPGETRMLFTGGPYAYVKIGDGCNHRCAFCAIPAIRGHRRSRSIKNIVGEVEHLLENGVSELNLVSQDVTSYGKDRHDGAELCILLKELASIGGEFWIRLLYAFPSLVTDELLAVMGETDAICNYLDVPVQHSHPEILATMRRAGTTSSVRSLPQHARTIVPGITLRTTCLVGFPGETDEHFQHLASYARTAQFDHLGVFTYSSEDGTAAADLPHQVNSALAEERRRRLLSAQRDLLLEKNGELIGQDDKILLEMPSSDNAGEWIARSRRQAPEIDGEVIVSKVPAEYRAGAFVTVTYTAMAEYDMRAEFASLRSEGDDNGS